MTWKLWKCVPDNYCDTCWQKSVYFIVSLKYEECLSGFWMRERVVGRDRIVTVHEFIFSLDPFS